jgi:hypothetical protein
LVLATIVWASLSDFITASQSSAAKWQDLIIHELCLTPQIGFSSKHGAGRSRFRVQLWNEFHDVAAWVAAQPFASAFCLP